MQAIFPISMVVAVLSAIAIVFLLISLLFPSKVPSEIQVNVETPQGESCTQTQKNQRGLIHIVPIGTTPQGVVVAEVKQTDPLDELKNNLEKEIQYRAGLLKRPNNRKQRRSIRKN